MSELEWKELTNAAHARIRVDPHAVVHPRVAVLRSRLHSASTAPNDSMNAGRATPCSCPRQQAMGTRRNRRVHHRTEHLQSIRQAVRERLQRCAHRFAGIEDERTGVGRLRDQREGARVNLLRADNAVFELGAAILNRCDQQSETR